MILFIQTPLHEENRALLRQEAGDSHTLIFGNELPAHEQLSAFQQADILLGNPPAHWLIDAPKLMFWQLDSAGFNQYNQLNLEIPVANMGDFFAWPCAETIIAGILALYRRIDELAVLQRAKKWVGAPLRPTMRSLHRQRVVVLGAGTIGQAVHTILTGFHCTIQLMARTNPDAQLHSRTDLLAALPAADLLINCLPGTVDKFVDREVLATMKPGSVFANVGRGNTADEAALLDALQQGRLGGAVLDVTEQEPLPAQSPLWTMPNVLLTQHTAGGQQAEDAGKIDQFVRNLTLFTRGEPIEHQIDLKRGY